MSEQAESDVPELGSSEHPATAPGPDEFEVSLFGPGYGEAVAVHVADSTWILVDSCYDRDRGATRSIAS